MIDILICSIYWRAPSCLSLLNRLKAQTLLPNRVVVRADSWSTEDLGAARGLGAEVLEVEPGCGYQPRWTEVENWSDPSALVLVLDDDVQPTDTALADYAAVIGDDHRIACSHGGISVDDHDVIRFPWGNALALYPEALRGLSASDLGRYLRKPYSDEPVLAAWLCRNPDVVVRRHPHGSVWPSHALAHDPRSDSAIIDNLRGKLLLIEAMEAKTDPKHARVWASARSTTRHQILIVERQSATEGHNAVS